MQQASATRLRCDPTEYARKQQEKKERAKELKDNRHKGVFNDDHTFTPKVNPREKGKAPSSREEDERPSPAMQQQRGGGASQYDDIPIRPSKTLQASSRKEILGPEETPIPKKTSTTSSTRGNSSSSRPNNNADHHSNGGDQESDALDTLSRAYPKKKATASRQPEDDAGYSPARPQPEHDSLYREVKRTTGHDLEDIPIAKLNTASKPSAKHTGPCLRNSSCACPKCGGGGGGGGAAESVAMRSDPPVRRREPVAARSTGDSYSPQTNTSRSANGSQSEMENSLTLLKSKLSRQKARTAPSNQASLYGDQAPHEPASKSARQQSGNSSGYAAASSSSSTTNSRRAAQQQQQQQESPPPQKPAAQNARSSQAQAPAARKQPSRHVEEERAPATTNRRLPRHQEEDNDDQEIRTPPPPISSGFANGEQPDEYADDTGEMEECDNCHRRFNVVSFTKHRKICEKVFSGPRKVFNMAAKRLEGTEAEKLLKQAGKKGGKKGAAAANEEKPIRAKPVDWKQQSNAFRDAMRANRDINLAVKEGRPLPAMAPSAPDPSLILCDYCGRRFNDKAADRHITFCKEKAQRSGGGPPPKKAPAAAAKPSAAAAPRAAAPRKR